MENMSTTLECLSSKVPDEKAKGALIAGVCIGRYGPGKPDTNPKKRGVAIRRCDHSCTSLPRSAFSVVDGDLYPAVEIRFDITIRVTGLWIIAFHDAR